MTKPKEEPVPDIMRRCPFCGSVKVELLVRALGCWGYCRECKAGGPVVDGRVEALHRWNQRSLTQVEGGR